MNLLKDVAQYSYRYPSFNVPKKQYVGEKNRTTQVFQQLNCIIVPDISPAILMVNSVLRNIHVDTAELAWVNAEQHWQCRVVNGPCAGLLIDAHRASLGATQITLTAPDFMMQEQLQQALVEIKQGLLKFGEVEIKVSHVFE